MAIKIIIFLLFVSFITIGHAVLSRDDEDFYGVEADEIDWRQHPCRRDCKDGAKPLTCRYKFVVEVYSSMSKACYNCPFNLTDCYRPHCIPADGVQKSIFVVNRQMPGPSIEVCRGDRVVVSVVNAMLSESTTIHWHGIDQNGTPHMDGVPYITQCPILPGETFEYQFLTNVSGTYFWHSHIGAQRADGEFGPLIVYDPPSTNLHYGKYDYDYQYLILNDWTHESGDDAFAKLTQYQARTVVPDTLVINGFGRYKLFEGNETSRYTPLEVVNVKKGYRHRLRIIGAGAENCPIEVAIDNHTMYVASLDANDIKITPMDAITISPGERIDVIIHANQKVDNYWIRFRGVGLCNTTNVTTRVYQVAILRYKGAEIADPKSEIGYNILTYVKMPRVLNPSNQGTETREAVSIPQLKSLKPNDPSITRDPDMKISISFDFYNLDNYEYHRPGLYGYNQVTQQWRLGTLQLNGITFRPQPFPLLTQREQIQPGMLCNLSTIQTSNCSDYGQCACTQVINLRLNDVVEITLIDQGLVGVINHPFHIHGHFFRVVSTENLGGNVTRQRIKQLDREGKIKRNLNSPPLKDTMKTPGGGYTIIRLYADNPGYWFFHCHFEQHVNIGMALTFKVGEHEDMPPVPKNFPKCGNFKT